MDPLAIPTVETERLRLRAWRESDLDAYLELTSDPEAMRYIGGETMDRALTWRNIATHVGHWAMRGYGFWAVDERATGAFVGRVGLWYPEGWPSMEVGWALVRRYWGKGYAAEAARAALAHAWRELEAEYVISLIFAENSRSIAVAERIGERFHRTARLFDRDCVIYRIDRPNMKPVT